MFIFIKERKKVHFSFDWWFESERKNSIDIVYRTAYNLTMGDHSGNKEKILQCALELFSSKGYEASSVQELVIASAVTKPTLYYYFGSKEGVYEFLVKVNYEALDKIVMKAAIYTPNTSSYFEDVYPVLVRLVEKYFYFAKENHLFYRMVLTNVFKPQSSQVYGITKAFHFRQYELIENMFKSISSVHKNLERKEKMLTWSFLGMINSFIGLYFNDMECIALDTETAIRLVKQFMHGIYS